MHPLKTSKDPLSGPPETLPSAPLHKSSHDRPRRPHAPSEDLQRPSQAAQETPCDHSGPFWTIVEYVLLIETVVLRGSPKCLGRSAAVR